MVVVLKEPNNPSENLSMSWLLTIIHTPQFREGLFFFEKSDCDIWNETHAVSTGDIYIGEKVPKQCRRMNSNSGKRENM